MRDPRMEGFVAEVRSRSDILPIVQAYVPLKRKGGRYWGCCPFHHEKTPSFNVEPEKGFFYCFGCHAGGDVFKFISMIENITYFEAVKFQAEKLNIPLPQRQLSPQEEARQREIEALRKVNEMARDFFHNCLMLTRYGEPGKAYFAGRGISEDTIKEFSLGYAPEGWDKLTQAFRKRGVSDSLLLQAGLAVESRKRQGSIYDRFRQRVMIPIADEQGHVVGFGGRVLDDSKPKYLNTAETVLFNKRRLLFGLDRAKRAIQREGYAIVVEGYMDAISVFEAGIHNVVASLGTAFTVEHAKKLLRYAQNMYFCYDSDEAGQNATIRALSLTARDTGASLKVIAVPEGKDPDEFIKKRGAEAFRELVQAALPLADYRLQYVLKHVAYDTADGKERALQAMLPVLAGLNGTVLGEYRKKLSRQLMIDEGLVNEALARYRREPLPPEELPARAPTRRVVRKSDGALQKAGRTIIRAACKDAGVLAHLASFVPLEGIADDVQREILAVLQKQVASGRALVPELTELSEAAAEELSRALVEELEGRDEAEAYLDAVQALRKAYLSAQYLWHTQESERLLQAGDKGYVEELNEVKRIRDEMDGL